MKAIQTLQETLRRNRQQPSPSSGGVYSVCCSHSEVLRAAISFCRSKHYPLVIESTSNQVDQYGGYTGMKPADFMQYVQNLATELDFPKEQLILGGDHLGPNAWQNETGETAMQKAQVLVADYVRAGYRKIHLDASMACAADPANEHGAIADELVASRAAQLCQVAEQAWQESGGEAPVYIIGTEVPVPGGQKADEGGHEETVRPTSPVAARQSYQVTRDIFAQKGLAQTWQERVIAMVVQPGVEFGDDSIICYQRSQARKLSELSTELGLVFEAHSTDYQPKESLRELVQDHYAILKVGPWLSYAYREALFALDDISQELARYGILPKIASFRQQVEQYLLANPKYWEKYYQGSHQQIAYKCLYSLSDRIRYYWPQPKLGKLVAELLGHLGGQILPYSLVNQYFPQASGHLGPRQFTADQLIRSHIQEVLRAYEQACL